jgi:hypothetical protein
MAIHGICIVKNEVDVIAQMLRANAQWCDHIYVFDNGSDDGTWEIVKALSRELPAVVPFKQDPKPFTDSLRAEILSHYIGRAQRGDWWCVVDADEFYVDDPRAFLARVPRRYRAVWPQLYTYLFTDKDAEVYRQDPGRYAPEVPVSDRLHHYQLGEYSELRFFRHDPHFTGIPADLQPIFPERIRMRHFGYRSPEQIARRLQTRREPMERGEFVHEKASNWQPDGHADPGPATEADMAKSWEERIVPHGECHFDDGVDTLLPPRPWIPPEAPQRRRGLSKLGGRIRRAVGRMTHFHTAKPAALDPTSPLR